METKSEAIEQYVQHIKNDGYICDSAQILFDLLENSLYRCLVEYLYEYNTKDTKTDLIENTEKIVINILNSFNRPELIDQEIYYVDKMYKAAFNFLDSIRNESIQNGLERDTAHKIVITFRYNLEDLTRKIIT